MGRFVWTALGLLLVLGGCGPAREASSTSGSHLQRILAAGELRVGTSADLPPLGMHDRSGQLVGLEIDLVRKLGDAMNLKVQTSSTWWSRGSPSRPSATPASHSRARTSSPERRS
jgi:ABC-type amino acid transport substrate-binding protein